ncbi:hypothetical protein C0992_004689, partial [Termitomyces sp. T32_za158]
NLELVDFPADIPARAEPAQLLFLKEVIFPAPPSQLTVVKLTTDPCTPAQYNGLTATVAAGKGKQRAVPAIEDDSDYGQSQSEEDEEAEEGELAAQRFQRMQRNKKLAKKKANRAKAAAALVHRAQNDFLGCIPDGLEVKSSLTNTIFVGADANHAAAFEFSSGQSAKVPGTKVYQFARRGFPGTPYELERLYKYYANPHVTRRDRIVAYMLLSKLKDFTQHCNVALHNRTMMLLCSNPAYWDLVNPMQSPEDLSYAEKRHIPSCFLRVKDDGTTALRVMRTPDPNVPFDLDQIARYALIFGRPGMENTWQGIAVDFAYRMHWQTLFGFALCRALCANSAGKTTLVRRMALVMARPGLYCEAIDAFNKVYDEPFAAQYGPQLTITQVHVPDDKRLKRLKLYRTPAAIPQWDGWRELTEEDHYHLMFKRAEESAAGLFPEADGLYYYIEMDPNVGQLWKRTPAHGTMPSIGAATNIALTDCEMVDVTAAGGPTTPPITESEPLPATTNVAIEESAKTTEAGGSQPGEKTG